MFQCRAFQSVAEFVGNKRLKVIEKKERKQKNPLTRVGGSVGEYKEREGGDRINLVAAGCSLIRRKLYLNFY